MARRRSKPVMLGRIVARLNLIYCEDLPNPPDTLLEACDRFGILYGQCFYACGWPRPGADHPRDLGLLLRCTEDLIKRYRNHPSLAMYMLDRKGNIWMAYGFFRYDFQGLDEKGNPIYQADKITVLDPPDGVRKVARVCYLDESDTLIVADEGRDLRHIGRVFACKGYLAGNRKTVSFEPSAGKEAACVAAAGDYVFTGGWKERGRIGINRLSDGAQVGMFDPGPTVGGVENTGWIDILTGITAFKRANGEYLVFVEEDYKAKVLMYRWKP